MDAYTISIHAPRVGRDLGGKQGVTRPYEISIHAPRVGRDTLLPTVMTLLGKFQSTRPVWGATTKTFTVRVASIFQSTRPVWGATVSVSWLMTTTKNFNPRAPCGARQEDQERVCCNVIISIHAPRVGRDSCATLRVPASVISIHAPRVGRDGCRRTGRARPAISIHAPRVGRDHGDGHS